MAKKNTPAKSQQQTPTTDLAAPAGANMALAKVGKDTFAVLTLDRRDLMAAMRENLGGGGLSVFDLDRIRMPAGGGLAWELPSLSGPKGASTFTGVIVAWQDIRVYWKDEFSGGGTPPDCSSNDCQIGHPADAEDAKEGGYGGSCEDCPKAQFGSSDKGGKSQACKQCRRLVIFRPEDRLPILLTLPPTSLKPARQFFTRLLGGEGLSYYGALVEFGLEGAKNPDGIKYSVVTMKMVTRLTPEQIQFFREIAAQLAPKLVQIKASSEDMPA